MSLQVISILNLNYCLLALLDSSLYYFPATGEGFKQVLGFRFDLHPRTLVIEESTLNKDAPDESKNDTSDEDLMFYGLSPLHVACVFDQVGSSSILPNII